MPSGDSRPYRPRLDPVLQAERRARLLQATSEVGQKVTSILDLDELLPKTVDIICDAYGFYYAGVFLIDDTGQWAALRAGRGAAGAAMIAEGHKLAVGGNSMIGAATGLREARIALDVGEEAVFFKNPHLPKTRSEMALPLVVGDEVLGAVTVQSEEEAAFTQEDISTLQNMADQLAIAIKNSRLHQQNQDLLHQTQRRARLLQAAHAVGHRVTSILKLDELLPKMVDIICDAYGFYYAGVFLIDDVGQWAVLRAGRGAAGAAMIAEGHKLAVGGNSMIGAASGLREARIALDVGEEAVFFKNPHLPKTRSEMALPLVVGDEVLGAVTVQSEEEAAFTQEDISTLQNMADQLAVAIKNSRLHQQNQDLLHQTQRRARLLQAAHAVGHRVTSILKLDELLPKMVDIICDAYGFYYAGVFLIDDVGQWAVLRAGRGAAGAAMIAESHKLAVGGNSMIGAATGLREARIALHVGEEAVFFKNPHLPKTRSEMALPLIVGDEVLGAVTVQSEEEAAFTQEDISTLQNMADQLAVAIKNSRLHQQNQDLLHQTQRRARLLQAAHAVGHRVTSILNLDELLPKTVDIICDAYGFYYAGVFLIDDAGQWAVLRAGRGAAGVAMIAEGHKLAVGGNSMIGAATGLREARIALDVGEEAVFFKNPHLPHTRSEMALPLVVGDDVLGAVTVQSVEERAFSDDDITTLQTMADHLAVAIRNAHLVKELERAHAE